MFVLLCVRYIIYTVYTIYLKEDFKQQQIGSYLKCQNRRDYIIAYLLSCAAKILKNENRLI